MYISAVFAAEAGGAGGTPNPTPTPTPTPAPVSTPWHSGVLSGEALGHAQNKGWTDKTPAEAAVAAINAHYEAQRMIGVPETQLVRLPANPTDEAAWKTVWGRLGVPVAKEGYDFSGVKFSDGTPLDEGFTSYLRDTAHRLNIPKEAAAGLASSFTKFLENQETSENAELTANLARERDTLGKNWGSNFEVNKFIATQGAARLGFTPEEVAGLEKVVGYAKVMEAMRRVGEALGEHKYVAGQGGTQGGVMTMEQAQVRKRELMNDATWRDSYLKGDNSKVREMTALNTIIASAT